MRYSIRGISVRRTPVGRGVFATRAFRKNQVIGQMRGSVITTDDYDAEYAVDLGRLGVLDPWVPFRYLNHSCEPNAQLVMHGPEAGSPPTMWVEALRTIRAGEQITIDYAWPADSAIRCLCGSRKCRGWVVSERDARALALKAQRQARASEKANAEKAGAERTNSEKTKRRAPRSERVPKSGAAARELAVSA
ncbi:MAG TPA: SET domain-containing protein [Polyangiaceae bacterium]|jgi:hypothetical protein|nr:SET domain-containing protein [Polyangiaceae bacterium]